MRVGPVGVSSYYLLPAAMPWNVQAAETSPKLRGSAEYCI